MRQATRLLLLIIIIYLPSQSMTISAQDWVQEAYVKASNTDTEDRFAWWSGVAISGDTMVVGAPFEASGATGINGNQEDNSVAVMGAAYVYVHNGTSWEQQAYLKPSTNTNNGKLFGTSVAIDGDTIVVSAPGEGSDATGVNGDESNDNANGSGAVYVFVRDGVTWTQQAYLKASNTDHSDAFGVSVAIDSDTIVVGAPYEDSYATGVNGDESDNDGVDSGAAYVFVRDGVTWTQQAYIKASNTDGFDGFGYSVAVDGNTIVVGAFNESGDATGVNGDESSNDALWAGAAYVFVRDGLTWTQQAYLKASNTDDGDEFGISVAISTDMIAVGARYEDSSAIGIDDDQNKNMSGSGAAYVFVRDGGTWTQQTYIKASNTGELDFFGSSVALDGNRLIVGAPREASNATGINGNEDDNTADDSGAAYVFVYDGITWTQQAYLKASNTDIDDQFGNIVDVNDGIIAVGAPFERSSATGINGDDSNNDFLEAGAVYVFELFECPVNIPDGDVMALITAIECANTNPDVNTINLAPNGTYDFTSAYDFYDITTGFGSPGYRALPNVTTPIVINGNNATLLGNDTMLIASDSNFGLFLVSASGNLTLQNMVIRDFTVQRNNFAYSGDVMFVNEARLTLDDVTLTDNGDDQFHEVIVANSSHFDVTNTDIVGNASGAMYIAFGLSTTIENSNISDNVGRGISSEASNSTIINASLITGNQGLAVGIYNGEMTVNNSFITGNASSDFGVIYNAFGDLTLNNVTVAGNKATGTNGIVENVYSEFDTVGNLMINNSILWGNDGNGTLIMDDGNGVFINSGIIEGGWLGAGSNNFDANPLFVNPLLPSTAPSSGGDYHLESDSPAINHGDNSLVIGAFDIDGESRIQQTIVDIGADERLSPYDVNYDGKVSPTDVIFVLNRIGLTPTGLDAPADVNRDGQITEVDAQLIIAILVAN